MVGLMSEILAVFTNSGVTVADHLSLEMIHTKLLVGCFWCFTKCRCYCCMRSIQIDEAIANNISETRLLSASLVTGDIPNE
jgi:hypothetical protein